MKKTAAPAMKKAAAVPAKLKGLPAAFIKNALKKASAKKAKG